MTPGHQDFPLLQTPVLFLDHVTWRLESRSSLLISLWRTLFFLRSVPEPVLCTGLASKTSKSYQLYENRKHLFGLGIDRIALLPKSMGTTFSSMSPTVSGLLPADIRFFDLLARLEDSHICSGHTLTRLSISSYLAPGPKLRFSVGSVSHLLEGYTSGAFPYTFCIPTLSETSTSLFDFLSSFLALGV